MPTPDWDSTDGAECGGHGEFSIGQDACNIHVCDSGAVALVDLLRAAFAGNYKVGLFQSNAHPQWLSRGVDFTPCNFSGYAGEQITSSWSAGVIAGERAQSQAAQLVWTHDGGGSQNWVYGYYVVDPAGNFIWAERFCPGPKPMRVLGDVIRIKPLFTLKNEFKDPGVTP